MGILSIKTLNICTLKHIHSLTHSLIHTCNIEDALRLSNQQSPPQLTSETMATLFDFLTTLTLCFVNDKPGFWRYLGVTRTLNTTYFRPVAVGDVVAVEVSVMQVGKKLAPLKGEMRRLRDGALMAVCEHGKVNTDADYAKAKL